jgi:hypothetical protein
MMSASASPTPTATTGSDGVRSTIARIAPVACGADTSTSTASGNVREQ